MPPITDADLGTRELLLRRLVSHVPPDDREDAVALLVALEHITEECALWLLGRRASPYLGDDFWALMADRADSRPIIVNYSPQQE